MPNRWVEASHCLRACSNWKNTRLKPDWATIYSARNSNRPPRHHKAKNGTCRVNNYPKQTVLRRIIQRLQKPTAAVAKRQYRNSRGAGAKIEVLLGSGKAVSTFTKLKIIHEHSSRLKIRAKSQRTRWTLANVISFPNSHCNQQKRKSKNREFAWRNAPDAKNIIFLRKS